MQFCIAADNLISLRESCLRSRHLARSRSSLVMKNDLYRARFQAIRKKSRSYKKVSHQFSALSKKNQNPSTLTYAQVKIFG